MNNSSISFNSIINGVNHDIHDVVNNVIFGNKNQNKWWLNQRRCQFFLIYSVYVGY